MLNITIKIKENEEVLCYEEVNILNRTLVTLPTENTVIIDSFEPNIYYLLNANINEISGEKVPNLNLIEDILFSVKHSKSPISITNIPESIPVSPLPPHSPENVKTTPLPLHNLDTIPISPLPLHSSDTIHFIEKATTMSSLLIPINQDLKIKA